MLAIAGRLERRVWPFVASGLLLLIGVIGIVLTASWWTFLFAGMPRLRLRGVLTLGFALPALLGDPADVARMSAAMFTISYSEGLVISVLSGAAFDLAGNAAFAFLPIGARHPPAAGHSVVHSVQPGSPQPCAGHGAVASRSRTETMRRWPTSS